MSRTATERGQLLLTEKDLMILRELVDREAKLALLVQDKSSYGLAVLNQKIEQMIEDSEDCHE